MKINCVILNYNDAGTVENLVRRIKDYRCVDRIVVVDNASTDDSWQRLQELAASAGNKVTVIHAEKNGGYGAGNNLGIRYAVERNKATHVLIANPDVFFTESCVLRLARIFQKHPEAGIVTAAIQDKNYKPFQNSWKSQGSLVRSAVVCGSVFCMIPLAMSRDKKPYGWMKCMVPC